MATRGDRVLNAAVRAAIRAKQWADRLLFATRQRVESEVGRRRLKRALLATGRVLQAAGRAAVVAGVATGITALAERQKRKLAARRRPKA